MLVRMNNITIVLAELNRNFQAARNRIPLTQWWPTGKPVIQKGTEKRPEDRPTNSAPAQITFPNHNHYLTMCSMTVPPLRRNSRPRSRSLTKKAASASCQLQAEKTEHTMPFLRDFIPTTASCPATKSRFVCEELPTCATMTGAQESSTLSHTRTSRTSRYWSFGHTTRR